MPPATTVPSATSTPQSHVGRTIPGSSAQAHANQTAVSWCNRAPVCWTETGWECAHVAQTASSSRDGMDTANILSVVSQGALLALWLTAMHASARQGVVAQPASHATTASSTMAALRTPTTARAAATPSLATQQTPKARYHSTTAQASRQTGLLSCSAALLEHMPSSRCMTRAGRLFITRQCPGACCSYGALCCAVLCSVLLQQSALRASMAATARCARPAMD
jgi:hypothetical protein